MGTVAQLALLAAVLWPPQQERTMEITVGGGKVGASTYSEQPDGTFRSKSHLEVGPTKIESTLVGAWKDGRLERFRLEAEQSGRLTTVDYADGKMTVESGGAKQMDAQPVELPRSLVFSALHPQMCRTLVGLPGPGGKASVLVLDNAVASEAAVERVGSRNVRHSGGGTEARSIVFKLAGLDIEVVTDGATVYGLAVPAQQAKFVLAGAEGVFDDPFAKYPELSQPRYAVKRMPGLAATMRDGTKLVGDLALPDRPGKWPTVLVRTCYGKELSMLEADFYASRGYAYFAQDVRGRGASEGEFDPLVRERADGYDTLEWIEGQPWSDGRVGMVGASYLGFVQWCAAVTGHPALKCIVPQVSPPDPVRNFPWDHGLFLLTGSLWWTRITAEREGDVSVALTDMTGMKKLLTLPLNKADDAFRGKDVPFFDRWLERDSLDKWKGAFRLDEVGKVKIPVLHVSGTWDGDGIGTKLHWEALRKAGHRRQWMVFGPWTHLFNTTRSMGEVDYGPQAILELQPLYLRFFDTWLKGREGLMDSVPKAKFFLTGANRWLEASDWPLPSAKRKTWYLAGGHARGWGGGGRLAEGPADLPPATYVYDPAKAEIKEDTLKIEVNGSTSLDTAAVGQDALVFKTQAFAKPTRISGPVEAHLYVSTSARDAGFFVTVGEEGPDGKLRIVGLPGKARIGWKEEGAWGPVKPGEARSLTIRPWEFAHEFGKGSKMVVMVNSDAFPSFARVPGTGEPDATATKLVKATQTVYRTKARPSRIVAHVIPG